MNNYKIIISLIAFSFLTLHGNSQVKETDKQQTFSTSNIGKSIIIQYRFSKNTSDEKVNIILYRGNEKNENVKAIHQLNNLSVSSEYYYTDSMIPKEGVYLYTIEVISNGTVLTRERATAYNYPTGLAPFIKAFDATAKKKSNEVKVSWKIGNLFLAGNIALLRSRKYNEGFETLANLKITDNSFIDKVNDANEPFFYRLQITDIRKGDFIYCPIIQVLADFIIKPKPPQQVQALVKNGKPQLRWESSDEMSRGFYVYKRGKTDAAFYQASGIITKDLATKYLWTDTSTSLMPGSYYQYAILSESNSYTKSIPSDTVTISLENDKLTLSPPVDIRIITNNDTSINIAWTPDSVTMESVSGYTVYQKKIKDADYRLLPNGNAGPEINYITVNNPEAGTSFIVKSKTGDKESVAGQPVIFIDRVNRSFGPEFIKGEVIEDVLYISWHKPDESNIKEYRLYKWQGREYLLTETINKNINTALVKNYKPEVKNQFMLTTVNTKGIENKGTRPIIVY